MIFPPSLSKSNIRPHSTLEIVYVVPFPGIITYGLTARGEVDSFLVDSRNRGQYFQGLPFASVWTVQEERTHESSPLSVYPGQWHLLIRNKSAAEVEVQVQISFQPTGMGSTGPAGADWIPGTTRRLVKFRFADVDAAMRRYLIPF